MNDSMIFYRSFYEAVRLLPPELRVQAYDVIMAYGIDGEEPEEMEPFVQMVFTLIKPQVDANSRRRSNGGKGGRPTETNGYENKKPMVMESDTETETNGYENETEIKTNGYENESETETNGFENETKTETNGYHSGKPNVNVNVNVNENVNDNENVKESKAKPARFVPPSITDVKNYADANGLNIDAERFVDFYSSKGWTVGKSPMKDWRAAARNWSKRDRAAPKKSFTAMTGRDNAAKYAQLEAALLGRATG